MPKDHEKFNLGIVGCGLISQTWLDAIKQSDNVHLIALMDNNEELAKPICELTDCPVFKDIEHFIRLSKLDGAIVCTPPVTHFSIVTELLQAGISVLCEKPLALNIEEGSKMYETAKQNDVILMMASKFRYSEDVIRAKSLVATGVLGKIHFYQNQFCSQINMHERWNANPKISGGGVIMDNGPHAFDIIRYLLGPIHKIFAYENGKSFGLDVEDTATISVITKNNIFATLYLSWSVNLKSGSYIEIYGTDGGLKVGWKESAYQRSNYPDWIPFGVGYNKIASFKNQLQNFIATVNGTQEPLINEQDGLASIRLVDAAYESIKTGRWVSIEESQAHAPR